MAFENKIIEKKLVENNVYHKHISKRFRSYLPVVVDVETAGFNPKKDALLEVAVVILKMDEDGMMYCGETYSENITPFEGANLDEAALKFTGITPFNPFRMEKDENTALRGLFAPIRNEIKATKCTRAILVGHNPTFDLNFINAATERNKIKRNPFHQFSTFDTATLGGLAYGQTVLSKACEVAGMRWDDSQAHSAKYDTEQTAELFCRIVNQWAMFEGM
ncbi:MAG: ribonuclease T [Pseudomonadota bacterium]